MPMFRKKPFVIEAVLYDGTVEAANEVLAWIGTHGATADRAHRTKPEDGIFIHTLEGIHHASQGDWIIKGVKGEFYPIKNDIFRATYDPA